MKKGLLIICLFAGLIGCENHYDKANAALEDLKYRQKAIDSLFEIPEYLNAMQKVIADNKTGKQVIINFGNNDIIFSQDYLNELKNNDSMAFKRLSNINLHLLLAVTDKNNFKDEIKQVKDNSKQLELINKFDRIYVLKIEK